MTDTPQSSNTTLEIENPDPVGKQLGNRLGVKPDLLNETGGLDWDAAKLMLAMLDRIEALEAKDTSHD